MTTKEQIVKRDGREFVLVPVSEYRRLKRLDEAGLPPLPEPDQDGNYPAVESVTVSIAREIIQRRRKLRISQVDLAHLAGVRPETINRLEAAKHVPSVTTVDKIDRALRQAESKQAEKTANGRKRKQ